LTSIVERYGKEGSAPAKDRDGLYQRQARGFMGKEWDGGDIAFRTDTWKLAYDLLKPGGYLLAFSASRNYHRMAVAIEDAGFEIRDQIMWIYGSGFPKSLNVGDGWGTALKPAHEPIVMARKPLEGTNKQNIEKYGTGGINIDGCRIQGNDTGGERKITTRKSRDENNVWTDENSGMKQEANHFADADPKGRYPANVMHDGSDVVQEIFPQTSKSVSTKRTRKTVGMFGMPNDATPEYDDEGTAARYFYCPKTSKSERNDGLDNFKTKKMGMSGGAQSKGEGYDKGQGIGLNRVIERKNTHPTVKPIKLMKYLCRLVTPKGGTVLDPFMGSGSTGMAAKDEGFDFIGIEKEKEYFEISESRINRFAPLANFM
jgi:site-specific DNA-methyltransferase (adenine-specific)